ACAGSIPGMSSWDQAKMSWFRLRNPNNSFFFSSGNRDPTNITFVGSAYFKGTSTSSSIVDFGPSDSSSIYFMYASRQSFDCYLSLVGVFVLTLGPFRAAEKHFLAEVWSPLMSIV
ncbi:hypothetical protein PanWU01x14_258460, partial [Parasponia andersonii]